MNQWINHSHPMTLRAAVILGYITAFFGLLFPSFSLFGGFLETLLVSIGIGAGAFGSANNRRWGYLLLAVCSVIAVLQRVALFVISLWSPVAMLSAFNASIFTFALLAAVLHVQSREYQKIWFE